MMPVNNDAAHADDAAIDAFAAALKIKMADGREKGRAGWQSCPVPRLEDLLRDAVAKGDPRDIAIYAMMIWHNTAGAARSPWNDLPVAGDLVFAPPGPGKEALVSEDQIEKIILGSPVSGLLRGGAAGQS
jgi:hypothetical protein